MIIEFNGVIVGGIIISIGTFLLGFVLGSLIEENKQTPKSEEVKNG